jgi:geranylgeranyl pyrophosphate synthase
MESKKLIVQVNRLLTERSKKALEIAKKDILQEKRESKEINDAFRYYAKAWNDVVHPGLISIACEAVGGKADDTTSIQIAMLLLTAGFDVHDDIIDESKTKYGKPTVFAKFGKDITLLVGDAFLMKALVLLHKLEKQISTEKMDAIWNIISGLFFELGDAEALEASLKSNIDISPEECFRILKMKASTFEAHMRIGAIIGGGEQDVVDLLGDYGRTLGILVSIREDFIDVFEAEELQNRAKNEYLPLPILHAFKNPQTKKTILDYLSKQKITDDDAEQIVDIVFEDKNVEMFRNEVMRLAQEAYNSISTIPNKSSIYPMKILIKGIIEDL